MARHLGPWAGGGHELKGKTTCLKMLRGFVVLHVSCMFLIKMHQLDKVQIPPHRPCKASPTPHPASSQQRCESQTKAVTAPELGTAARDARGGEAAADPGPAHSTPRILGFLSTGLLH